MLNFTDENAERKALFERKLSAKTMLITYMIMTVFMLFFPGVSQPGGWFGFLFVLIVFGGMLFVQTTIPIDEIFLNVLVGFILTKGILSVLYGTINSNTISTGADEEIKIPFMATLFLIEVIVCIFNFVVFYNGFRVVRKSEETMPFEVEFFTKSPRVTFIGTIIGAFVASFFVSGGYDTGEGIGKVVMVILFFVGYLIVRGILNGTMKENISQHMDNRREVKQQAREEMMKKHYKNKVKGGRFRR